MGVLFAFPKQDVVNGAPVTDAGVVYTYPDTGGSPLLQIDNPQPQVSDDFGSAVSVVNGGDIIVSARFVDNFANNDGSVFVHDGVTGNLLWSVANPVADAEGLFGSALAGSPQGHVIVGAANDDTGESNSGKVFVFDGLVGDLIQIIDNPTPGANFNFGQGVDTTPTGQIAVGAFGADGGFGTLHLFTSISAGSKLDLLNEQPFSDANLQSCVLGEAASNGWATVDQVTTLNCAASDISDLTGIEALTDLTTLDLSNNDIVDVTALEALTNLASVDLTDNGQILCSDLDDLETALGAGVVTRPVPCNTGGGILPQSVQNLHNAQGQRAVKTVNNDASTTIHFIYDQAGQVIAEIDASTGETVREYVYVNGMQIALVDDTGTPEEATYFVHNDHLNTPQKITDDEQAVVWAASYEPFGEVTETVADIENNIRFPGQYADGESGLHYNYFRDYDPTLGRYVESDPIGLEDGLNTYTYVGGNPVFFIDPYGLQATGIRPGSFNQIVRPATFRSTLGTGRRGVGTYSIPFQRLAGLRNALNQIGRNTERLERLSDSMFFRDLGVEGGTPTAFGQSRMFRFIEVCICSPAQRFNICSENPPNPSRDPNCACYVEKIPASPLDRR